MATPPSSPALQLLTTAAATHFPIKSHVPNTASPPVRPQMTTNQARPKNPGQTRARLRYRSGTGKKAELRKAKKGKSSSGSGPGMYLPPVPLKESVSGGLKVEFGFSPYTLLLVELATGKSVINYHRPAIVLIQIYFVTAVTALYVKYEKEKVGIWPEINE
ncbi:immunophilin family protein [Salix suchowensis]|nr:immunophilin family protein [Salix suchowensis]